MGLDMYLSAVKYESNYAFQVEQNGENETFNKVLQAFPNVKVSADTPSLEVSFTVGYWRKANAIHGWFVENCGGGEDTCQEMYVSHDHLKKLLAECELVLKTLTPVPSTPSGNTIEMDGGEPADIMKMIMAGMAVERTQIGSEPIDDLPLAPVGGFFFGGTERDEWYFQDVRETAELIINLLETYPDNGWRFSYRASW